MKHIPTTQTAVNRMKALAKRLAKERQIPYLAALGRVAHQQGYENFHHVTVCLNHRQGGAPMPKVLAAQEKPAGHQISFDVPARYLSLIQQIAVRADKDIFSRYAHISQSILTTEMDLSACHAQGCELDFERLLAAPAEDFEHDILGIRRHLNRETGYLEDFFVPRYAKAQY